MADTIPSNLKLATYGAATFAFSFTGLVFIYRMIFG